MDPSSPRWSDWKVFAQYGRTMLSVELLERSLKQWAHFLDPAMAAEPSFEDAWLELRPLLQGHSHASAPGSKQVSPELARELGGAVATAHRLRHGYLLAYSDRARRATERQRIISELQVIGARLDAVRKQVDEICAGIQATAQQRGDLRP